MPSHHLLRLDMLIVGRRIGDSRVFFVEMSICLASDSDMGKLAD